MKTIIKVKPDYDSSLAWELYKEFLQTISEDQDIHVTNKNSDFLNVLPIEITGKGYRADKPDYKNQLTIECRGYSQGDWDTYTIYYNELTDDIKLLAEELKKIFTHKNEYYLQEIEELESGHSKVIDTYGLVISNVEFPDKEDIEKEIKEQYNLKYDELIINQ